MILIWVLIFWSIATVQPQEDYDVSSDSSAKSFIELTSFSYEDACLEAANAYWKFINNPNNKSLMQWTEAQEEYNSFKKNESHHIVAATNFSIQEPSVEYKFMVARKPGDALLNATQWRKSVFFAGKMDLLRMGNPEMYDAALDNRSRQDVELLLSRDTDGKAKQSIWLNWHERYRPYVQNFSENLALVPEAAKANGAATVDAYWELLSGYPHGYMRIQNTWAEISSLHKKLKQFVEKRLLPKYNITSNAERIPAHLLGSLGSYDWTNLLSDIAPYGNVTYSLKKNILKKNLFGQPLYKSASSLSKVVLNEVPEANFWTNSEFNKSCPAYVVNFCQDGSTRVSTCHLASIKNFLSAHKVVGQVLTSQMNDVNVPILSNANRYSGLEYGVSELLSILSVSPGQLKDLGLVSNDTDSEHLKITSLLITALDVLPRLAYYMASDLWRIKVIKENITESDKLIESWWQHRRDYELIEASSPDIPEFLDDDFIVSNKPYLPKFVGTILAFQLYEHMMESTATTFDRLTKSGIDKELVSMIKASGADEWTKLLRKYLEIGDDEITPDALIDFFSPLEMHMDESPEDGYPLTERQRKELRELEELYKFGLVTINPTTTTTTRRPTVKKDSEVESKKKEKSENKSESDAKPPVVEEEKEEKKYGKFDYPGILDEEPSESESTTDDKLNTSKAVWAVAAVLIGTVLICIIAIFGRRRCVKSQTPKNRRPKRTHQSNESRSSDAQQISSSSKEKEVAHDSIELIHSERNNRSGALPTVRFDENSEVPKSYRRINHPKTMAVT